MGWFTAYVSVANKYREECNLPKIINAYCNSHSRRRFDEAEIFFKEAEFFKEMYREIYHLESSCIGKPPNEILELRSKMVPFFEQMTFRATEIKNEYSTKSSMGKATNYFLKNYNGLTLFLTNPLVPIDNNAQERLLRSPVVGRKTWYGTHSERGAKTAANLFTLVESCKLNKVNPREYFKRLVSSLHQRKTPFTPREFHVLTIQDV